MNVKRKKFGFTPLEIKVSNRASERRSNRFLRGPVRKIPSNGAGFTLVEMLTVLGIIALLLGLLLPALGWVRRIAREAKQKAQLTTIGLALEAFKNDYGDYPPSDGYYYSPFPLGPIDYCGAQKLAEALLGWDLLGFHPQSNWNAAGTAYGPPTPSIVNLKERKGPYLELATTNAFRLGNISVAKPGLFDAPAPLAPDTFVLCDVFGIPERRITLANGKTVTPGTPILYYRANTSNKRLKEKPDFAGNAIYDYRDNTFLVGLGKIGNTINHPLLDRENFYEYIKDPKVEVIDWPYRPDSYILISAGADGLYGTPDDVTNFGN